ncbi:MAG: hypothetical protein R2736_00180 [Solirubrobacterales bacterium]
MRGDDEADVRLDRRAAHRFDRQHAPQQREQHAVARLGVGDQGEAGEEHGAEHGRRALWRTSRRKGHGAGVRSSPP